MDSTYFIALVLLLSPIAKSETEFENGKFYIINSVSNGKAMSLSSVSSKAASTVVTAPWIARDTQTWVALLDSNKEGRTVVGPKKFVLVPQKQSWNWKEYVNNGELNMTLDSLPADTKVLTLDSTAVNLTQEAYSGESSQKWITENAGNGEVLIRNWGNQQCVKNFDKKADNFLESFRRRIDNFFGVLRKRKSSPLGTLTCDFDDASEKWVLEPAYLINFRNG